MAITEVGGHPSLVIVMPVHNEAGCVTSVVHKWGALASHHNGVLLVLNDGSTDDTAELLEGLQLKISNLKVIDKPNEGHGATILRGYREALELRPDWVFQTDSDDQFIPDDFAYLWNARSRSPFLLGCRRDRNDPFHRLVITRINRLLLLLLFGVSIQDANIPYRLIHASFLRELLMQLPFAPFAPNIFLSVLARSHDVCLLESPVSHVKRRTGGVSIVRWSLVKACVTTVRELIAFRIQLTLKRKISASVPPKKNDDAVS